MEDINFKGTFYGQCRCCLARGHLRDLKKEYFYKGILEVYQELILEIFNLNLSSNTQLTTLICTKCIQRLRDANSFRMMVVSTEKQLLDSIVNDNKGVQLIESNNVTEDNHRLESKVSVKMEELQTELKLKRDINETLFIANNETDFVGDDQRLESEVSVKLEELQTEVKLETDINETSLNGDNESDLVSDYASDSQFENLPPPPTAATLPYLSSEYCKHLAAFKDIDVDSQKEIGEETRKNTQGNWGPTADTNGDTDNYHLIYDDELDEDTVFIGPYSSKTKQEFKEEVVSLNEDLLAIRIFNSKVNTKKERQKRYRAQNREKLKQREAERRYRKRYPQSVAGPSTSNIRVLDENNEEIPNNHDKKREYQRRYRERNRDKLKQREAERRRQMKLQNAKMIQSELSSYPPNIESIDVINEPTTTIIDEKSADSQNMVSLVQIQHVMAEISRQNVRAISSKRNRN